MKTKRSLKELVFTVIWIIILMIIVVWLNLPWNPIFQGLQSDSGVYAYIGSAIVHGQVLYRDVWEQKPPIGLFLNALAVLLFGQTPWAIWWFNLIWIALSSAAFFWVIKKMFGLLSVMIASVFFIFAVMLPSIFQGGNLMEIYGLLPQVLLIGVTYGFFKTRLDRWVFVAGLLTAVAFMTKQTTISLGIASLLTITVIALLRREWKSIWKRLACFMVGLLLPLVVATLYWLAVGALRQYLAGVFFYSLSYIGVGAPFLWSIKHTALDVFPGLFISKLYYLAAAAIVLFLMANIRWLWQQITLRWINNYDRSNDTGSPVEFTMLAVFVALPIELVFTSLGGRNLGHYFLSLIPATATTIGYIFWKVILFLEHPKFDIKGRGIWMGVGATMLGLGSLMWLLTAFSGEIPTKAQLASFPRIFSGQYEIGNLQKYILAVTGPNDPVLVWHIHISTNFVTDRHPPQRVIFPGELFIPSGGSKSGLAEFLDEMSKNPPKLIVVQKTSSIGLPFVNVPIDQMCPHGGCLPEMLAAMKSPDTLAELQKLREYFLAHYTYDTQIEDLLIYKRVP